jgi:integrase
VVQGSHVAARAIVMQKKTQRPVQLEITEQTRETVAAWVKEAQLKPTSSSSRAEYPVATPLDPAVFPDRRVLGWSIGLDPGGYGTHSVRRTKATLIYRRTKNLRAVQLLLGNIKLESTVRYLGIEVDDALGIAERTEL